MLKVAILDNNKMYLGRLQDYWSRTYGGFFMVYAFSERERLMEQMTREKFDILLVESRIEMDWEAVPSRTLKIYLLAGRKDGEVNGIPALAKNGSADELYNKVNELYKTHMNAGRQALPGKMVLFTSADGGCGTSSCAVGYGKYLAARGSRVLYLNLELVSAQEVMLDGDSEKSMEDLFYLCETSRRNVDTSIRALVARDSSGLQYIRACRNPLELQEKSGGDIRRLLTMVTEKGDFEVVVVDRGFYLDEVTDTLIDMSDTVVLVAGADELGRQKQERTMTLLDEMNRRGLCLNVKLKTLVNRGQGNLESGRNVLGNMPEWKGCDVRQVTERMSGWQQFGNLLQEQVL